MLAVLFLCFYFYVWLMCIAWVCVYSSYALSLTIHIARQIELLASLIVKSQVYLHSKPKLCGCALRELHYEKK